MAEEPKMKLYALAVAAIHNSEPPQAIGVQSVVALLPEGVSIEEAGPQAARDIFPEAEGWGNHYFTATEITQGFPLEPYSLTWQIKQKE